MKLRRLMQNCPLRTKPPRGSVVRHSKFGFRCRRWVKSALERQREPTGHVRFAPKADKQADVSLSPLCAISCREQSQQAATYSITSSAINCIALGTGIPSAAAVPRLMTSSNLVGWSTGRSPAFSPLRMRPA
jgi:hypothetical protein